jgi:hypothetical protein
LPPLEPRLQQRYEQLVKESLQVSQAVAAGIKALPTAASAFAQTQAAWRFLNNPNVTLPALAEPLLARARSDLAPQCDEFALVAHDWSHLHYNTHASKTDRVQLAHSHDHGYELQTALLLSDRTGQPLAPLCLNLVSAEAVYTTRPESTLPDQPRLDELAGRLAYLQGLGLERPLVHIIDREADSVGHYRQWVAAQHRLLVRAKGGQRVEHEGATTKLAAVAQTVKRRGALSRVGEVAYKGRPAQLWVGETTVVLTRPTRQKRKRSGRVRYRTQAGPPVSLRLVVSEVRDRKGRVLAQWLLLSNLDAKVNATQLAQWYYWRWRIESFFKLLKGAGHQLEQWQQQTGEAVARRLLVASAACVLVWELAGSERPEAGELREVLVRLSGRQMKRGRGWTAPALLAGVWVLLAMLAVMEQHDVQTLKRLAAKFLNPEKESPSHAFGR